MQRLPVPEACRCTRTKLPTELCRGIRASEFVVDTDSWAPVGGKLSLLVMF